MVFFGDALNKSLSEGLASQLSTEVYYPDIVVFGDGERRVRVSQDVVGQDVVFVKTTSLTPSFDAHVLETSFLIDTFKRSGAQSITLVMPYVPYSRADHVFRSGEAVPLQVVIHVLQSSGLSKIIFADPHTIKMPEMFSIEVGCVSALPLFADKIREIGFDPNESVIVSPDMGGLRRMEQLSELLDNLPFASVQKERDYESGLITASAVHGEIKKNCFIIDDIISSGKTIVQAVEKLAELGAENIYVFATHPIFSENASHILEDSNALTIFVTDSLPVPEEKQFKKLEVLSLARPVVQNLLEG